jgi:hypothetical protein
LTVNVHFCTLGRMQDAWFMFTLSFLAGLAGGLGGRVLVTSWISRRCTNLENAVGDLQQRQSSFKGKEMAKTRWEKADKFDAEVAQLLQTVPEKNRKRYDNDPLGE